MEGQECWPAGTRTTIADEALYRPLNPRFQALALGVIGEGFVKIRNGVAPDATAEVDVRMSPSWGPGRRGLRRASFAGRASLPRQSHPDHQPETFSDLCA
jgi:hypothetical protein